MTLPTLSSPFTGDTRDPLVWCLETLARLHGHPRSADALTAGLPLAGNKLTPDLVPRAAAAAQLEARLERRSLTELLQNKSPVLLLGKAGGACLLMPTKEDGAAPLIWTPGREEPQVETVTSLGKDWDGRAYIIEPKLMLDERANQYLPKLPGLSWLWGTLWRYRRAYADVLVASLVLNLFVVASPLFVMNVYDRVVPNRAYETLWMLAAGVALVFLFDFLLKVLRALLLDVAGKKADTEISALLFERVMGARLEFRSASSGAQASSLREFESVRDFFTSATLASVIDLPFVFVLIFVIGVIAGPLCFVPLVAIPLVIGSGLLFQPSLLKSLLESQAESTQKHGVLVESIAGLETIKSLAAEGVAQGKWEQLVDASAKSGLKTRFLSSLVVNNTLFWQQVVYVAMVIWGVYLITDAQLSMGALIAASILGGRAMAPLAQVSTLMVRYQSARLALEGLNKLMETGQDRPRDQAYLHRPVLQGRISFDQVTFTYPGQKAPALNPVSFEVGAGEHVAILGRVGSGKSTLLKLINGLYRASEGNVRLDGIDQAQIDPVDLRRNIGYVEQEPMLFFGTLRENLVLGQPEATDEAVLEAAELAGVEEFVRRHPQGYDMRIGENGRGLSGGQKQAVVIARALLRKPPILLLDEPTAGMDQNAENLFISKLKQLSVGRTLVVVTHRPALLALVDRIVVVDGGRIATDGPKEAILKALSQPGGAA